MSKVNVVTKRLYGICGSSGLAAHNNKLIPGGKPSLGGKVPELRKLAKDLVKSKECGDYGYLMEKLPEDYLEEEMLKAFIIGYAKDDIDTILKCAESFVPKIHDWAVCDAFCQTFSIARKHRAEVFEWVCKYIESDREFEQRVVAVLLMSHFLVDEYYRKVLDIMDKLQHPGYYTKMGVAWCVATAYAKYPEATLDYLRNNKLDDWTYNKSIQKMLESFRVADEDKQMLRNMKRR